MQAVEADNFQILFICAVLKTHEKRLLEQSAVPPSSLLSVLENSQCKQYNSSYQHVGLIALG